MIAGGLTAASQLLPFPVASAQAAPISAATSAESWYRAMPASPPEDDLSACDLPVAAACTPVPEITPPSPYAPGTLHVGFAGGAEESRTYLSLDLSAVPFDAELVGGTLKLPVAPDPQAGTVRSETAALQACLVTAAVPDAVDGAITGAPEADCETASPAIFRAAEGTQPPVFTVDLAPFAQAWAFGSASLALVPAQEQAASASWHVAFSRRDLQAEGARPITAVLELGEPNAVFDPTPNPGPSGPSASGLPGSTGSDRGSLPPLDRGASSAAPLTDGASSPLTAPVAPNVGAPQSTTPVAAVFGGPFAYPAVFLLPLLGAAGAAWASRAFTRDLLPVEG